MKKLLIASITCLISGPVFADFIGVHASISQWQSTFSGEIAGIDRFNERTMLGLGIPNFEERGFEKENQTFGWVAFEHPVPLLPNFRLGYSKISDGAISPEPIVSRRFTADQVPVPFDSAQTVITELNINALDGTLYYEVLDNWISLDIGLTVRQMTGEFIESSIEEAIPVSFLGGTCRDFEVSGSFCIVPPSSETTDIDIILPLLYAKARFDLPLSGIYTAATLQAISSDGSEAVDYDLELGYLFDFTVLEMGAALGYRSSSLVADDLDGLFADAKLEGAYLSLNMHF